MEFRAARGAPDRPSRPEIPWLSRPWSSEGALRCRSCVNPSGTTILACSWASAILSMRLTKARGDRSSESRCRPGRRRAVAPVARKNQAKSLGCMTNPAASSRSEASSALRPQANRGPLHVLSPARRSYRSRQRDPGRRPRRAPRQKQSGEPVKAAPGGAAAGPVGGNASLCARKGGRAGRIEARLGRAERPLLGGGRIEPPGGFADPPFIAAALVAWSAAGEWSSQA